MTTLDKVFGEIESALEERLNGDFTKMREDYVKSGRIDLKPVRRTLRQASMVYIGYGILQILLDKLAAEALIEESKYR